VRIRGYVVEAHVARGGMGDVHRARVLATGELVAIKVMRHTSEADGDADALARERFGREARILAELTHPAIVRYVSHGWTVDGRPYLASEWLDGETLDTRFATRRMSAREAATIGASIASALAAVHAAGIVHRDVKPSNVIVTHDGDVKLFDFGIAKVEGPALTRDGALVGTHAYMAPEQLRGSAVGAPADVFGLGCTLFHGLVGRLPWDDGDGTARLLATRARDVREVRTDVAGELADSIACMLHISPTTRPTAAEVAAQLAAMASALADVAMPPAARDAISRAERGVATVVVVGAAGPSDATVETNTNTNANANANADALLSFFEARGARVEILAHGACVAVFTEGGDVGEQARVAARAALDVARIARGRPVAMATGRAEITGQSATGDAVARALAFVRTGDMHGVRVDDASASLIESRFVVDTPEGAKRIVTERSDTEVGRTVRGRVVPLFGREKELAALTDACTLALRLGAAAHATVVGPAGAGKSRLASEVASKVRESVPDLLVVITRSDPLAAGAPFGAASAIVKRLCGAIPFAGSEELAPFVARLAGRETAEDAETARAARGDPALMRDRLRDAFRAVIDHACATRPLVLVLDDAQWVDTASVRLVDDVLTRDRASRRLFVSRLVRPEPGAPRPSGDLVIELAPLDARIAEQLARFIVGEDATDEAVARIVRLGDGNAFFLEELARAAAATVIADEPLPESVIALTQSRLAALPSLARRVLRAASILRPRVSAEAVVHLLGDAVAARDVRDVLDTLVRSEVLVRRPGVDHVFDFRHELLAEAAYATLTELDARRGHLAAASFADSAALADPRRVAEHLERGGDRSKAAVLYARAAELTLRSGDIAGAIACADRADTCGAIGIASGQVLAVRSAVEKWHGDVGRAVLLGTRALELLDPAEPIFSEAAADVATAAGAAGDEAALADIAARLLGGPSEPDAWRVRALSAAALSLVRVGSLAEADRVLSRAESMRSSLERDRHIADIGLGNARAARRTYAGDPGAYLAIMPGVIEHAASLGDARTACLARAHLGYGHAAVGSWDEAERTLLEAMEESKRLDLPAGRASVLHNLARVREMRGDVAQGEALQREALALALEQRNARLATACRLYLARNARLAQKPEVGLENARLARGNAKERPLLAWANAILAEVLLDASDAASALAHAREAHAFFTSSGGVGEGDAAVHLALSRALFAAGDVEAARVALVSARDRLATRAAMLADRPLAERFLANVEENAATLDLCRREGIDAPLVASRS
jgi:hypothetical protein